MQLTSLITAAGLAVSASHAFLLPVATEVSGDDIISTLPVPIGDAGKWALQASDLKNVKLDCPGCPVRMRGHRKGGHDDERNRIVTDIPSHLELDFVIDHAAESDRLLLNGYELYPRAHGLEMATDVLAAKLVPEFKHHREMKKRPEHKKHNHERPAQPLGFGLTASTQGTEGEYELIMLHLQIIEVGNVFVDGIPSIVIKLLKTPNGGLLLGFIATAPSAKSIAGKPAECTTMLCRWKATVMEQVDRLRNHKPCGAQTAGHPAGRPDGFHRRPPHHNMHHGHHGHHRASWGRLLKNIASHILLPVAIGILAGVAASVLGMMVGTAIVCVWRTFFRPAGRRHHHRHSSHKAAKTEAADVEEKSGLMAHQDDEEETDAPPAYAEERVAEDKEPENEV